MSEMLLIISGKRGMAFLLEASFTLESFFSLLFQPINISLTHFSPIQLLKRLSFSRLRADRNVHQEMPWGQLSVTHQSAALKIWMVDYMSMVKQIKKKKSMFWSSVTFFLFGNGFSYAPPVVMVTGYWLFQVHSKQIQMHGSGFSAISQHIEIPLGFDKD